MRTYLPKLDRLRRIHLMDVSMSPSDAIGLAEVVPECRNMNHISIVDNPQLAALATATEGAAQEEACALYASLMTASRLSRTLIAIDVEVPGPESNEIVQALAKQVVAYCLANMEQFAAKEAFQLTDPFSALEGTPDNKNDEVPLPDVLAHLVGEHDDSADALAHAPDLDYVTGGAGVVKALSYCLGQKAADLRRVKSQSGTASPGHKLARIRIFKRRTCRLTFLDDTLASTISRFEDEYPETRVNAKAKAEPVFHFYDIHAPKGRRGRGRSDNAEQVARFDIDLAGHCAELDSPRAVESIKPLVRGRHRKGLLPIRRQPPPLRDLPCVPCADARRGAHAPLRAEGAPHDPAPLGHVGPPSRHVRRRRARAAAHAGVARAPRGDRGRRAQGSVQPARTAADLRRGDWRVAGVSGAGAERSGGAAEVDG
ncbi:hypothetical protein MRB53_037541 [Persea americana]|nr:hypothetical protein MRB53_037541 [Persea americana]